MNSNNNDWHDFLAGRMTTSQLPQASRETIGIHSNGNYNSNINNRQEDARIAYENSIRLLNEDMPTEPPRLIRQPNYIHLLNENMPTEPPRLTRQPNYIRLLDENMPTEPHRLQ